MNYKPSNKCLSKCFLKLRIYLHVLYRNINIWEQLKLKRNFDLCDTAPHYVYKYTKYPASKLACTAM